MNTNFDNDKNQLIQKIDGNHLNSNLSKKNQSLVNTCIKLSISYIVLCLISIILVICLLYVLSFYSKQEFSLYCSSEAIGELTIGIILCLVLFILGAILIDKVLSLRRYYFFNYTKKIYLIQFWIGLYACVIPSLIIAFIYSIITLVDCNKIKKQNIVQLESTAKNEYFKSYSKQKNQKLFESCKWLSISYIVLWIIAVTILIPFTILNNSYYLIDDVSVIETGVCFAVLLFVLTIIFIVVNLSLKNHFFYIKSLYIWFLFWWFFFIPPLVCSILILVQHSKIKKQYKQYFDETLNKKIKKSLTISSIVFSSTISVVGIGLIAGTYSSYSNSQSLAFMWNKAKGDYSSSLFDNSYYVDSVADFKSYLLSAADSGSLYGIWFVNIAPWGWNAPMYLSGYDIEKLNSILENQKNIFYNLYPTSQSKNWKKLTSNLTDEQSNEIYSLQECVYNLNFNYGANQAGLIAGSVLLSVGLLVTAISITSLVMIQKKNKNK